MTGPQLMMVFTSGFVTGIAFVAFAAYGDELRDLGDQETDDERVATIEGVAACDDDHSSTDEGVVRIIRPRDRETREIVDDRVALDIGIPGQTSVVAVLPEDEFEDAYESVMDGVRGAWSR